MRPEYPLDRRIAVPALIGQYEDFLFITGLGGTARDVSHLTRDGDNLFALGGAMGASLSMGLGLALARPDRSIMVVTGDGEMLMGIGTLATIAVMNPKNLSILCVDNGYYLETGGQMTHTGHCTDLELMAKGAGFKTTRTVNVESELAEGHKALRDDSGCGMVVLRVKPSEPPVFKRNMDATATRLRMKAFLASSR